VSQSRSRIVIIGGGPGRYEAALVAARLDAQVTVTEESGLGGAWVLTAGSRPGGAGKVRRCRHRT
jgi:dihydrolipoamide dehydrogenase